MSHRILIIDDEEAIRKSFILALEDVECEIDTAESGEKGIAMFQSQPYALVYLDLKMPGMDGVETLRAIRRLNADVPVYIVTAFFQEFFDRLQAVSREGLDFEVMRKPIGADDIVRTTCGILNITDGDSGR